LLGRADTTLRDMCGPGGPAGGVILFNIVEPARLQQLRDLSLVGRQCKHITSVKMAHVIKLCKHMGNMDALLADMKDKFRSAIAPPPLCHSPGTNWGIPLTLSPLSPAATTPAAGPNNRAATTSVGVEVIPWPPPAHRPVPPRPSRMMEEGVGGEAAAAQPAPPPLTPPRKFVFPIAPPDMVLLPEQQVERYALEDPSTALMREVQRFMDWSAAPINTERSARYIRAVQSTTMDKVPNKLWGFLGYTAGFFALARADISLQLYADPRYVARFVGYIKAREVGIGHIRSHMGLARKVNDYLQSGAEDGSEVKLHAAKMERWLMTMEAQLTASIQRTIKSGVPDIQITFAWVETLCEDVLEQVDWELLRSESICHPTAVRVQQALLAALVTGCYCPPCRLHVLQTMIHPRFNGRLQCQDMDCMNGRGCMGNHLMLATVDPPCGRVMGGDVEEEPAGGSSSTTRVAVNPASAAWPHFDYAITEVSNVIVHHKNDR